MGTCYCQYCGVVYGLMSEHFCIKEEYERTKARALTIHVLSPSEWEKYKQYILGVDFDCFDKNLTSRLVPHAIIPKASLYNLIIAILKKVEDKQDMWETALKEAGMYSEENTTPGVSINERQNMYLHYLRTHYTITLLKLK